MGALNPEVKVTFDMAPGELAAVQKAAGERRASPQDTIRAALGVTDFLRQAAEKGDIIKIYPTWKSCLEESLRSRSLVCVRDRLSSMLADRGDSHYHQVTFNRPELSGKNLRT